jgi:2-methylcitrate dehydratase PrpD
VTPDPALDPLFPEVYASIVEIETKSGRRLSKRNDIARGYPESPLGEDELTAKFDRLAGSVAGPAAVATLKAALDGLPAAPSAVALGDALREARGGAANTDR